MILKSIVVFFKTVISAVSKAVAWLLIALGLWLPAIYSAVFFIVCAVTKTSFSSIRAIFFVGLAITTALSVWYTLSGDRRKVDNKKKSTSTSAFVSKIREKEHKVEFTNAPPNGSVFRPQTDEREREYQNAQPNARNYDSRSYEQYPNNGSFANSENYSGGGQQPNNGFQSYHPYQNEPARLYQNSPQQSSQPSNGFQSYHPYQNEPARLYQNSPQQSSQPSNGFQSYHPYQNEPARLYQNSPQQSSQPSNGFQSYHPYQNEPARLYQNSPQQSSQPSSGFQPYHPNQNEPARLYQNSPQQSSQPSSGFQTYHPYQNETKQMSNDSIHSGEYEDASRTQAHAPTKNETPRIFLSRRDSTVLIYEYSDRLDFYRKTRSGIIYDNTKYKN